MKIKKNLAQFENTQAFLVVTDTVSAYFYRAHAGEIEQTERLQIELVKAPKRKNRLETRPKGVIVRSGAPEKDPEKKGKNLFIEEVVSRCVESFKERPFGELYIFSPDYVLGRIESKIPKDLKQKLVLSITGNFTDAHPFEILKRLEHEKTKKNIDSQKGRTKNPLKEKEVRSIIERGK